MHAWHNLQILFRLRQHCLALVQKELQLQRHLNPKPSIISCDVRESSNTLQFWEVMLSWRLLLYGVMVVQVAAIRWRKPVGVVST